MPLHDTLINPVLNLTRGYFSVGEERHAALRVGLPLVLHAWVQVALMVGHCAVLGNILKLLILLRLTDQRIIKHRLRVLKARRLQLQLVVLPLDQQVVRRVAIRHIHLGIKVPILRMVEFDHFSVVVHTEVVDIPLVVYIYGAGVLLV